MSLPHYTKPCACLSFCLRMEIEIVLVGQMLTEEMCFHKDGWTCSNRHIIPQWWNRSRFDLFLGWQHKPFIGRAQGSGAELEFDASALIGRWVHYLTYVHVNVGSKESIICSVWSFLLYPHLVSFQIDNIPQCSFKVLLMTNMMAWCGIYLTSLFLQNINVKHLEDFIIRHIIH